MRLAPLVANTLVRTFALSTCAKIVSGWAGRNSNNSSGANRFKHLRTLKKPVLPHCNIVRMVIKMDIRNWLVELVLFVRMQRHAVSFLGHVFPHKPDTSR